MFGIFLNPRDRITQHLSAFWKRQLQIVISRQYLHVANCHFQQKKGIPKNSAGELFDQHFFFGPRCSIFFTPFLPRRHSVKSRIPMIRWKVMMEKTETKVTHGDTGSPTDPIIDQKRCVIRIEDLYTKREERFR